MFPKPQEAKMDKMDKLLLKCSGNLEENERKNGAKNLARWCEVCVSNVYYWKKKDSIPSKYIRSILEKSEKEGFDICIEDLI